MSSLERKAVVSIGYSMLRYCPGKFARYCLDSALSLAGHVKCLSLPENLLNYSNFDRKLMMLQMAIYLNESSIITIIYYA